MSDIFSRFSKFLNFWSSSIHPKCLRWGSGMGFWSASHKSLLRAFATPRGSPHLPLISPGGTIRASQSPRAHHNMEAMSYVCNIWMLNVCEHVNMCYICQYVCAYVGLSGPLNLILRSGPFFGTLCVCMYVYIYIYICFKPGFKIRSKRPTPRKRCSI